MTGARPKPYLKRTFAHWGLTDMARKPTAFPHPSGAQDAEGLTKIEYFAGQALAGLLASQIPGSQSEKVKWAFDYGQMMARESAKRDVG